MFVTENHDAASVTKGGQFDTVYHEHLRYYTPATLSRLLAMHGLEYRTLARPQTRRLVPLTARRRYPALDVHAASVAARLRDTAEPSPRSPGLRGRRDHPGHPADALHRDHRLHHACARSPGSDKIGREMPGTGIPIVDERELIDDQPAYAVIFAWHLADTIIPKLRKAGYEGNFIIPLPEPKIIKEVTLADSFTDHRGTIEDLLVTPLDSVTRIFTKAGAVPATTCTRRTTSGRTWSPASC